VTCEYCNGNVNTSALCCEHCGRIVEPHATGTLECEHHPIPAIGLCVVCARPVCSDCAVVHDHRIFCGSPEHPKLFEEYELLYIAESEFEVDLIRRNNPDATLQFRTFPYSDHWTLVFDGRMNGVRLFVHREAATQARDYLKARDLIE